jgi:hypothetical protein
VAASVAQQPELGFANTRLGGVRPVAAGATTTTNTTTTTTTAAATTTTTTVTNEGDERATTRVVGDAACALTSEAYAQHDNDVAGDAALAQRLDDEERRRQLQQQRDADAAHAADFLMAQRLERENDIKVIVSGDDESIVDDGANDADTDDYNDEPRAMSKIRRVRDQPAARASTRRKKD